MKWQFKTFFNVFMLVLVVLLSWSVWTSVAQTTNENAEVIVSTTQTNKVKGLTAVKAIFDPSDTTPEWIDSLATRFPYLKHQYLGNELWKYIFSLIYIFLAFYISKFLDFLTRVWLKKWAAKTETKFDDLVLELLNGPIKIIAFIIFLRIGLNVFRWPEVVEQILAKGFTVVVAFTITYVVLKFVDLLLSYWRQRVTTDADHGFDEQLFPVVRKSLKFFLIVVAVLVTSQNLGINVTAAITSLSIGGLAIGLAAQDTLANLFGAVAVFIDKPFRLGDVVRIDQIEGSVESIGMRSTRVRNGKGHLVTIPNKAVGNAIITNISHRPTIQTELNIGLTYDTSVEQLRKAIAILEEVYRSNPMTKDLIVNFNRFADSALNIQVIHFWGSKDFKAYLAGMQEMNISLKQRFDAEKINFAFPTQTLHVKQDSEWQLRNGNLSQGGLLDGEPRATNITKG